MIITDLSIPEYAGPGIGESAACGLCNKVFDLMYPPDQYPTVHIENTETWELICDGCQDAMDADADGGTLDALRADLIAAGVTAESPERLDAEGEQIARQERWT